MKWLVNILNHAHECQYLLDRQGPPSPTTRSDNLEAMIKLSRRATSEAVLLASLDIGDKTLFNRTVGPGLPYETLTQAIRLANHSRALQSIERIENIKALLRNHRSKPWMLDLIVRNAIHEDQKHVAEYFLTHGNFNTSGCLEEATRMNQRELIEMVLQVKKHSNGYCAFAGISGETSNSQGLQSAIMNAVDSFLPEALDELLSGNVPLEILMHARDRAIFNQIYWEAKAEFPDDRDDVVGSTQYKSYLDGRDERRNELRNAVPDRFKNRWVHRQRIKSGNRAAMIERLESEIARR